MSDPVLRAVGLKRSFSSGDSTLEVLKGASLEVARGEIVALMGPSGSGKSTLLYCLGGLDRPDAGDVQIAGEDLWALSDTALARLRNQQIGFVFQFHHLLPDFTALENVMLPGLIAGATPAQAERSARAMLDAVGLAERESHAPAQLSGGEQQRVAMARALVNEPAVVFADEPSGNLDTVTSASIHEVLLRLRRERGATFVIATHDRALAEIADRILEMSDGALRPVGATPEVVS